MTYSVPVSGLAGHGETAPAALPPALRRLDPQILASFSTEQLAALTEALAMPRGHHDLDFRTSLPLPGGTRYLVVLSGPERRSHDRLSREGYLAPSRRLVAYAALLTLMVGGAGAFLAGLMALQASVGLDAGAAGLPAGLVPLPPR